MSARASDNKKICLNDLDESIQDDLEFDTKPVSSFQFFKNQEIPIFNYDMMENRFPDGQPSQAVWNDYVDFKIKVNDNGDDKVSITLYLNAKKHLEIPCQMFLPVFDSTKIMMAGSGSGTYIKQIRITQTEQIVNNIGHEQSIFGNKDNLKGREHFECCSVF